MKLTIEGEFILDEDNQVIAVLVGNTQSQSRRTITIGGEAIEAIEEFIKQVNSGKLKPKTAVKKFEGIISKYE